jgi:hypothetical protein
MSKEKTIKVQIPANASKKTRDKLIQAAIKKEGESNEIQIPAQ